MPSLPKDNHLMDRPYSGRAVLYDLLRKSKGAPVTMKEFRKALKVASPGRPINAFPRVLYWVGKAVEEYGYDLQPEKDKNGEIVSISLVKGEAPSKPKKKKKEEKPAKKKKTSKKEKPASKKTSKSKTSKKVKPAKKSKKDESESESESAESESAVESEDESAEG